MSTIEHKSTAKAALRNLLSALGKAGTLALLGEVLMESLPKRKGRPTREESVTRMITSSLSLLLPEVNAAEEKALNAPTQDE